MVASRPPGEILRFGLFELDVSAVELRKHGVRVKLQQQPLQVLICLLERSGKIVPREDLIEKLWPNGTVVEYEHSLGTAVNKIRQALGSTADNPRFVETLPRRGYRFLLPVERVARPAEQRHQPAAVLPPHPGGTISRYRLVEKIGEGGMGVVYKAEDTKLERPVALKFLAAHAIEDPEHKARFVREAKAAARLDHPNICSVYEIDEADGQTFLAMAYLEGQTVKDKIRKRPLKLDEALDIAIQTAQGLKAAHEKGIVHRDIKSANLMLSPQGRVKIMDFGLAQLADRSKLTQAAALLGTPAYMSPEQAQRQETDRRTDIWSLGVAIYEMVTGRVPFESDRETAVLHAIIHEDPEPITALRAGVPLQLDAIIGKALAKDRDKRYQDAADLLVDLRSLQEELTEGKAGALSSAARTTHPGRPTAREQGFAELLSSKMTLLAALALLALTTAVLAVLWWRSSVSLAEGPHRTFALSIESPAFWPAISPDGRYIAYLAKSPAGEPTLWVQDLSQDEPRAVAGPEREVWDIKPFWSHDSKFIFFRAGQQLRRVSVWGGSDVTICEQLPNLTTGPFGGTYSPDGASIVISHVGGLFEVPAKGGQPRSLIKDNPPEALLVWPHFLPGEEDSRKLLYVEADKRSGGARIIAHDLKSGQREVLVSGSHPAYDPGGHIIYSIGDPPEVWSVPFSIDTLRITGDAFPVREHASRPSVARDGTLIYQQGGTAFLIRAPERLLWRDREGKALGFIGQPQMYIRYPALSRDEKRVAVQGFEGAEGAEIWIHEVDRPVRTRLTSTPGGEVAEREVYPTWSPGGNRVAFSRNRPRDVFVKRTDGAGESLQLIDSGDHSEWLTHWSSDEKILFFQRSKQGGEQSNFDLWYLRKRGDREAYEEVSFLQTPYNEFTPHLSPDGRFVAYVSDESGQHEVYIRSFPGGGGRKLVSTRGGTQPRWRADGKELFYVQDRTLMAIPVATTPSLRLAAPEPLFPSEGLPWTPGQHMRYDVSRDGKRFVLAEPVEQGSKTIRIVQNWSAEFRGRQPD